MKRAPKRAPVSPISRRLPTYPRPCALRGLVLSLTKERRDVRAKKISGSGREARLPGITESQRFADTALGVIERHPSHAALHTRAVRGDISQCGKRTLRLARFQICRCIESHLRIRVIEQRQQCLSSTRSVRVQRVHNGLLPAAQSIYLLHIICIMSVVFAQRELHELARQLIVGEIMLRWIRSHLSTP